MVTMAKANASTRLETNDRDGFAADKNAFFDITVLWSLVAAIVLGLILLMTVNLLAPDLFTAVADLTNTLRTADLNSTLAEGIAEVIGLILPVGFILAFVAVPFAAFELLRIKVVKPRSSKGY